MAQLSHQKTTITRSRFTWLAYLMLGFYAYMQAVLGPIMPFLREELSLNYTFAGLHFSGFALGMIIAGSSGEQVTALLGRKNLFWAGGLGMSLSALILTFGKSVVATIFGAFMMGFLGTYLLVMIQALLSEEFSEQRAVALTEANLSASIFAALAPLVVAFGFKTGLDWRLALWVGGILYLIAYLTLGQVAHPASQQDNIGKVRSKKVDLPAIFRVYWFIVFVGVAIEWCMVFWLADFLITVRNMSPELASTFVSFFLGAMIIGRILSSRLTRQFAVIPLLLGMCIIIMIGFPIFWLGQQTILQVSGLIIIGLGLSNLFPLGLSAASNVGSANVDKASARVSQAAGFAILIAPQTLGTVADTWGIFRAYSIVPLLLLILIIMIIFVQYLDTRSKLNDNYGEVSPL